MEEEIIEFLSVTIAQKQLKMVFEYVRIYSGNAKNTDIESPDRETARGVAASLVDRIGHIATVYPGSAADSAYVLP